MIQSMNILILSSFLAVISSPANAVDLASINANKTSHYCLHFARQNYTYPTETQLVHTLLGGSENQNLAGQSPAHLRDIFWRTLIDLRLFTGKESASILLNYCGPRAVTLELTAEKAERLRTEFARHEILITDVPRSSRWSVPSDQLQLIVEEANQFARMMLARAKENLNGNIEFNAESLETEVR